MPITRLLYVASIPLFTAGMRDLTRKKICLYRSSPINDTEKAQTQIVILTLYGRSLELLTDSQPSASNLRVERQTSVVTKATPPCRQEKPEISIGLEN